MCHCSVLLCKERGVRTMLPCRAVLCDAVPVKGADPDGSARLAKLMTSTHVVHVPTSVRSVAGSVCVSEF